MFLFTTKQKFSFIACSAALCLAQQQTSFALPLANEKQNPAIATAQPQAETQEPSKPKVMLKGTVSDSHSVLLPDQVQSLPKGTKVALTMQCNLNSEISNTGDEIRARISVDVKDGRKVLLPGGWYVHGKVTNSASQKRLGRDGFVEVEFDKLVSPDGEIALPFPTKFSTHDNQLKAISKIVAIDTGYMAEGALGGALLTAQYTGIPLAIMTHGLSLAVGGAAGAGIGAIGALTRKGKIASVYPGDEVHLTLPESIELPGFDPNLLPSAEVHPANANLALIISETKWSKDPFGDDRAKLLTMKVKVSNQTKSEVSFFDLLVETDSGNRFYPSLMCKQQIVGKKIAPGTTEQANISFSVTKSKHKLWLVLLNRAKSEELTRTGIN
jgi:hypothetical protein